MISPAADCQEVLQSFPHIVVASPGALGVGIYAFDSAVPLRYVPNSYEYAPTGWYAPLLAPGTSFSIAVTLTPRSHKIVVDRGFQSLIVDVDVANVRAHPPGRVVDIRRTHEYVLHGYTTSNYTQSDGLVTRDCRRFVCGKEPLVIRVSARGAKHGMQRPVESGDIATRKLENLPTFVGKRLCVQRFVHANQPHLYGFKKLEGCTVEISLQTPQWLVDHGVFQTADLLPAAWIDRRSSVYRWPGMLIEDKREKSSESQDSKVS